MLTSFLALLGVTTQVASLVVPRDDSGPPNPGSPTVTGQGLQDVPDGGKAPNTFNNGQPQMNGGFPYSSDPIPDIYQPRDIDIPFGWMFHGNISLFPARQLNDPSMNTDNWTPNQYDNADQSACGIPDNAYFQAKAAIHPYFLKYAGLDRYCMQDVCISLWPEDDGPDMIIKVTDICGTDPSDPTYCATPNDFKMDRAKVQTLYNIKGAGSDDPDLQKPIYPRGVYWHFTKCWGTALPQPAYRDNWFAQPHLPNNFMWDVDATRAATMNNQKSYPAKGWPAYGNGMEIPSPEMKANMVPITDWVPGQEPAWAPIAGGKGHGTPERSGGPPPAMWPGKSTALAGKGGSAAVGGSGNGTTSASPAASSTGVAPDDEPCDEL